MRYKLGRIGTAEAASAACITLCVNGLTDIDQTRAYASGNSSYIWLPLAAAASTAVFLSVCSIVKSRGYTDLWQLLARTLGKPIGTLGSLMICGSLLICASMPLGSFTHVLDDLVYEGVEFPTLFAFLIPAAAFLAFKGLEVIGRVSRLYVFVLLAALAAAFITSLPSQMSYRMHPLEDRPLIGVIENAASASVAFLPALAALLVFGSGLQGVEHTQKAGLRAGLAAAGICFAVQLMLARLYTYRGLSEIFMPLCRVNYLGVERTYVMWLDKLLVMAWINGALISSGYCIYAAALLYARIFEQMDVTPAVLFMTASVCTVVLTEFESGIGTATALTSSVLRYGALLAALPLAASALIALTKRNDKGRVNENRGTT